MEIAITGASGLIGQALTKHLNGKGHRVAALVRRAPNAGADEIQWSPSKGTIDAASLEGFDAVIHMAGAGIGDKKWTPARKKLLVDSRTSGTRLIAETLTNLDTQPSVFICGSAIGFYGNRGDESLTEQSERGEGFLADLVVAWEAAAAPAVEAAIRTVLARTGIVMSKNGGALKKQLPLFQLGLGGRMGPGTQWLGWISIGDTVRAIEHLLTSELAGPVNLTAPEPVTNNVFTKALGSVLKRPTLLPVPMFGPRLLFGAEMVEEALVASQRVIPKALLDDGFVFEDPEIVEGLRSVLGR